MQPAAVQEHHGHERAENLTAIGGHRARNFHSLTIGELHLAFVHVDHHFRIAQLCHALGHKRPVGRDFELLLLRK
jgi:hypothetical protein